MSARSANLLRDEILAEARRRGVPLELESLTLEQNLPILRLRLGDRAVHGTRIGLPSAPGVSPDVVTVYGSGFRTSRMWPRRRDGTFNVGAIVDHFLALAGDELRDRPREPHVATAVPVAASGLHVIHAAAVRLRTVTPDTTPASLVTLIADDTRRAQILERLELRGLRDADLRLLSAAASLFLGRAMTFGGFDPLELFSNRVLTMLRIGARRRGLVEQRFVLILDRRGDEITLADPAGKGVVTMGRAKLESAWKLGSTGTPWLGTIGPDDRAPGSKAGVDSA